MDEFKRPVRKMRRPTAVDGFVSSGRPIASSGHKAVRPAAQQGFRSHAQPINAFHKPSGFSDFELPPVQGDAKAPVEQHATGRGKKHAKRIRARRSPIKRVMRATFVGVLVAAIVAGGFVGYARFKAGQVFQGGGSAVALEKNVDPVKLRGEGDGRINILMLGVGGEGHEGAYLTDTMLVASVDPLQNEASLISIPRDLWVEQDNGSGTKINAVFSSERDRALSRSNDKDAATKAGAEAAEEVVSEVLGIPIHYFVMVDFQGFIKAIDNVGGVEFQVTPELAVTEQMWDDINKRPYFLNVQPGMQKFDSTRALFYSRSRQTSSRGDFDRAQRQRALLIALKNKAESIETYANPVKVAQLLSTFGDHVRTDLTINEAMRLYEIGRNITPDKTISLGLADPPNVLVTTSNINGLSVVLPRAGEFNYSEIQNFIRNSVKDAFLKNENAPILVLNGTNTTGLAGKKSNELKSFGYNVIGLGDAPTKDYQKTRLIDLTNGSKKYTRSYLEKRLGLTAETSLPDPALQPGTAEFVIILGTDAAATP